MKVLHVGCGNTSLPDFFGPCEEVRLDRNPDMRVDIVADMTDMGEIGPFDAIYSSHCLEHVYPHQVPRALAEFYRVLADDGQVLLFVPDLEGVRPTDEVLFESPAGPITGKDLMYGYGRDIESRPYMAHHTGFVAETLEAALKDAGFSRVAARRLEKHNLMAVGRKEH